MHKTIDVLVITICAVICNANGWEEEEVFGGAKKSWFWAFLELSNGIPSRDTYNREFARLNAKQIETAASIGQQAHMRLQVDKLLQLMASCRVARAMEALESQRKHEWTHSPIFPMEVVARSPFHFCG